MKKKKYIHRVNYSSTSLCKFCFSRNIIECMVSNRLWPKIEYASEIVREFQMILVMRSRYVVSPFDSKCTSLLITTYALNSMLYFIILARNTLLKSSPPLEDIGRLVFFIQWQRLLNNVQTTNNYWHWTVIRFAYVFSIR